MMNIETLLQAAQILENQQSMPPKKRLARGDRQTPTTSHPSTSALSPATVNTHPTATTVTSSLIKAECPADYARSDHNLNVHPLHHLVQQQSRSTQQRFSSDQHDEDDDDDDDDDTEHRNGSSDTSNRAPLTCLRDREIHNKLEKHRRAHLKDCFDSLKAEVPCQQDRKITNLQVLNLAIKYIQTLTKKERSYEREIGLLASRNAELQQRLGSLKTELNSEGHDVDTWLDSCSELDRSVSTRTASEAEMYRTFDDDDAGDDDHSHVHAASQLKKSLSETKLLNGHDALDSNNNYPGVQSILNNTHAVASQPLFNNRKSAARQKSRPAKRKLASIPTTNLLHTLSPSLPNAIPRSENLLDYSVARHLRLDQPCNLLTTMKDNLSSTATLTPITDIRYEIVDMFTKGTSSHLQPQQQQHPQQHQQQISPLPSIASLMNRHASPIVSPTKQTIGINTDPLTTSTTNILHQSVAT